MGAECQSKEWHHGGKSESWHKGNMEGLEEGRNEGVKVAAYFHGLDVVKQHIQPLYLFGGVDCREAMKAGILAA